MKKLITFASVVCIGFSLSACSEKKAEKDELLYQHQVDQLKKAEDVEGLLKQADDARRKQLDQ